MSMIRYASPIMLDSITEEEIQETIDYISEQKHANGYYYPKTELGLLLNGTDEHGYDFMLDGGN